MQIPEFPAQRKFVSEMCHAHSNAQNCGSNSFDAGIKILTEMYCSYQYLPIETQTSKNQNQI